MLPINTPRQMFSVPANLWGRVWVYFLRAYLGPRYRVRLKSRGVKPIRARWALFLDWCGDVRDWTRKGIMVDTWGRDGNIYTLSVRGHPRYAAQPFLSKRGLREAWRRLRHRMRSPGAFYHDRTPLRLARRWGVYVDTKPSIARAHRQAEERRLQEDCRVIGRRLRRIQTAEAQEREQELQQIISALDTPFGPWRHIHRNLATRLR